MGRLLNFAMFYLGWFACVIGAARLGAIDLPARARVRIVGIAIVWACICEHHLLPFNGTARGLPAG